MRSGTSRICTRCRREGGFEGGLKANMWDEVNLLKREVECCGVLMKDDTLIHLFTKEGVHWTIPTHMIYSRLMVEHCRATNSWREQGKTALTTKSRSVVFMTPQVDSDDSDNEQAGSDIT